MIIIYFGMILLLILAVVLRPQITFKAILALIILAYVYFFEGLLFTAGGINIYVLDPFLASLAVYLILYLLTKSKPLPNTGQVSFKFFLLFFVWGLFAVVRNLPQYRFSAIGESRTLLLPILFYFFILFVYKSESRLTGLLNWVVSLIFILPLIHLIWFYLLKGGQSFTAVYELNEILFTQAQFRFLQAGESMMVASVAVGMYLFGVAGKRRWRGWLLGMCGLLLLIVLVTQIRSAWVALAIGLTLTPFVTRKFPTLILLAASAAVLLAIIAMLFFNLQNNSFVTSITNSARFLKDSSADETGNLRLFIWQQGWIQAMEHPIIGSGLGGYNQNVNQNGLTLNIPWHNGYLTLLIKFGALGTLFLLTGLGIWLIEMARFFRSESDRYYRLLGGSIAISVIMFAVFAFFYDFTIPFWVLLAFGTVLVNVRRDAAGKRSNPIDWTVSREASSQSG